MITNNLHFGFVGQLSVSVADPVHCPATGQVLVRERVPVLPHVTEQALQVPSSFQAPKVPQAVGTESYLD